MFRGVHIFMLVLLALPALTAFAQESTPTPRRTAEERAMKQTEMLVRDLDIRDSVVRDTIYRIHLRYARNRELVRNRPEAIECMNRLLTELKGILTQRQYERLEAIPRRHGARIPRSDKDSLEADTIQLAP